MPARILYLVGGAPRVGKSALAQRLLATDGIPWLPTDVVRTVLRRVLPELDAVDQDPVDAARLAELMYRHIEQAAEVCTEEAERFLIEGFELAPTYPARLRAALDGISVRACFLGHRTFSADDLTSYHGPKPQHEVRASRAELDEAAAWIRPPLTFPLTGHRGVHQTGAGPGGAINCANSAVSKGCPTSTWAPLASTSPCSPRAAISSAQADAVALSQPTMRGARAAVSKQF
jgi:hypothetical protein